jgi:hypothetical protein
MRWKNYYCTEWHRKFALFPTDVHGTTVWLESYWMRYVPGRRFDDDWDVSGYFEFSVFRPLEDTNVGAMGTELGRAVTDLSRMAAALGAVPSPPPRRPSAPPSS